MASVEQAVYTIAKANVTVVQGRVFPKAYPPNTQLPAMTYDRISGEYFHELTSYAGVRDPRFQLTAFSYSYGEALSAIDQAKAAFEGLSTVSAGVKINGSQVIGDSEDYSPDTRIYQQSVDLRVPVEGIL